MNTIRNNEIKITIVALTATAALVSGLLTAGSVNAAPTKKKNVTVKMSGSRRAAMNRSQALQTQTAKTSTAQTAVTPSTNAGKVQQYGTAVRVSGNVPSDVAPDATVQGTPINNPQGTPIQSDPQSNNPIGATNVPGVVSTVPGVVNNYSMPNGFALYGPPVVNTGNGFAPVYGTGYSLNGYTAAPYSGYASPYSNFYGSNVRFGF